MKFCVLCQNSSPIRCSRRRKNQRQTLTFRQQSERNSSPLELHFQSHMYINMYMYKCVWVYCFRDGRLCWFRADLTSSCCFAFWRGVLTPVWKKSNLNTLTSCGTVGWEFFRCNTTHTHAHVKAPTDSCDSPEPTGVISAHIIVIAGPSDTYKNTNWHIWVCTNILHICSPHAL